MQPRMAGRARPEQLLSLKLELVVPVVAALLLCAAGDVRQAEGGGPQGVVRRGGGRAGLGEEEGEAEAAWGQQSWEGPKYGRLGMADFSAAGTTRTTRTTERRDA